MRRAGSHSTIICGAERSTAIVVMMVKVVKVIRQNLEITNEINSKFSLKTNHGPIEAYMNNKYLN
jgi:hypothetical protein